MSTTATTRQRSWSTVTLAEYDALNTMRQAPEAILAAATAWRKAYATYAIVELGEDLLDPDSAFFTEAGEAWVRNMHERYHAETHQGTGLIDLAEEWVTVLGTMATVNILRTLEGRAR